MTSSPISFKPLKTMRDLLSDPAWKAEDLGLPLPLDPHAVSVSLPLWEHVVGYEENDPHVIERLQCGYPRFFVHPLVRQLTAKAEQELAAPGETAWLFASRKAAQRAATFAGLPSRLCSWQNGLEVMLTPNAEKGKLAWRFFGDGISSRRAEAALQRQLLNAETARSATLQIKNDLARRSGQHPEDVFLFPSGMAAMSTAHRLVRALRPGRPSVQIDFPYVDVLKVQQSCDSGVQMLESPEAPELEALDLRSICGVFTEIVSNPRLRTPPLARIASLCALHGVPLVADDTLATVANVDVYPYADIVTTSLTKTYSGFGNVLAGSLILRRSSPLYSAFRTAIEEDYADDFFGEDAIVLARNALDFDARIQRINETSAAVYQFLREHPKVEIAWYPMGSSRECYDAIRRSNGGYGGLLTFHVIRAERNASVLYDQLRICKGPSLGTNFSLACPYMLLAHYNELGWTDRLGINRNLLRLSVGLEPPGDLMERLDQALQFCT